MAGDEVREVVGTDPIGLIGCYIRTLVFTLREMGSRWRIMNREVT